MSAAGSSACGTLKNWPRSNADRRGSPPPRPFRLSLPRAEHESNNAANVPCFCMICRNLMTTFDDGRSITCRLPRFSALDSVLRASPSTLMRTMTKRTCDEAAGAGRKNEEQEGCRGGEYG